VLQLSLLGPQDGYFSWSLALVARIAAVEAPTVAGMATENRKLLLEPSLIDVPSFEAARAIATQFVTDVRVGNVKNNDPSLIEPIELTVA
jgi:hypothetical protein